MQLRIIATLFMSIVIAGCGTIRPNTKFSGFGEADPEKEERVIKSYKTSIKTNAPTPTDVVVLVDTIPEGIMLQDGKIAVESGYDHKIIGKVEMDPAYSRAGLMTLLAFSDYRTNWRKPYCHPQVILNYVTLTLWSYFVPLAYPCWGSIEQTKTDIIGDVKRMASVAGGDLAIVGYTKAVMSEDNNEVWGAGGYILKVDPKMKGKELKTKKADIVKKEKAL